MNTSLLHRIGHSLVVAAATALVGCGEVAPVGPDPRVEALAAQAGNGPWAGDLGACDSLRVSDGRQPVFHAYATGVQVYRWTGTSWSFVGPVAVLSADAGGKSVIGTHYSGPTWESVSGSKVVATVLRRCTADPGAIPWLLLGAVSSEGPGVFQRVAYIQRLDTVGGNAPSTPGSFVGEVREVPYTALYLFYRGS